VARHRFWRQGLRIPGFRPRPARLLLLTLRWLFPIARLLLCSGSKRHRQRQGKNSIQRKAHRSFHQDILLAFLKLESIPPVARFKAMKSSCSGALYQSQPSSRESGRTFSTFVVTGLVPVIPIRKALRFLSSGWPGYARP
jgi:hypothetical protein